MSWEEIIVRNPDVILIHETLAAPGAATIAFLKSYAPAASVTAIKQGRFIVMPVNDFQPGMRSGKALATLAAGLRK